MPFAVESRLVDHQRSRSSPDQLREIIGGGWLVDPVSSHETGPKIGINVKLSIRADVEATTTHYSRRARAQTVSSFFIPHDDVACSAI